MNTIMNLWLANKKKEGLKLHYADWQISPRYFEVLEYEKNDNVFKGILDNGEVFEYPANGCFWELYDENQSYELPRIS